MLSTSICNRNFDSFLVGVSVIRPSLCKTLEVSPATKSCLLITRAATALSPFPLASARPSACCWHGYGIGSSKVILLGPAAWCGACRCACWWSRRDTFARAGQRHLDRLVDGQREHVGRVRVHPLMGGLDIDDWHLHPEEPAVLIGTQDMLLSRR